MQNMFFFKIFALLLSSSWLMQRQMSPTEGLVKYSVLEIQEFKLTCQCFGNRKWAWHFDTLTLCLCTKRWVWRAVWGETFTHGSVRGWGWNSLALLDPDPPANEIVSRFFTNYIVCTLTIIQSYILPRNTSPFILISIHN